MRGGPRSEGFDRILTGAIAIRVIVLASRNRDKVRELRAREFGLHGVEYEGGNNVVVPRKPVEKPPCRFIITGEIADDTDERVMS